MAMTDQQVLAQLRGSGITSLDDLAKKIAEQSAAKEQLDRARGVRPGRDEVDYVWTGKNYSLYHPE